MSDSYILVRCPQRWRTVVLVFTTDTVASRVDLTTRRSLQDKYIEIQLVKNHHCENWYVQRWNKLKGLRKVSYMVRKKGRRVRQRIEGGIREKVDRRQEYNFIGPKEGVIRKKEWKNICEQRMVKLSVYIEVGSSGRTRSPGKSPKEILQRSTLGCLCLYGCISQWRLK